MHMLSGMHCGIQDEKKMNKFGKRQLINRGTIYFKKTGREPDGIYIFWNPNNEYYEVVRFYDYNLNGGKINGERT